MIATKQTKLTPPNKIIQEKQIKNTPKPTAVEEKSGNCCSILSRPTTNNINNAATTPTTNTIVSTTRDGNHHQYSHHRQQRPNETRSETKTMERNAQAIAAGNPSAIKSSSSVAVAAAAAAAATGTAASLLTTSTKIQQRQQKFLAAAAKSATSTQHSNHPQSALSRASVLNTSGARNTMASSTTAALKDETKGESDAACDKASDGISHAASDFNERSRQRQERATVTATSTAGSPDDHQGELISCVSIASKAVSDTTASEINSGDICQGESARKFSDDISDSGSEYRQYQQSSLNHQHHNHRHHHQQQQPEVRRQGESKEDIDDNINIKNNTIKHNNHNYYQHYYNHNYQNFHQHNYPHLQYQLAQITTTTTQSQIAQPQQKHVMAHYKFHNDCQSSVLTYEQVKRLDFVMDQVVPIHGRCNTPTLFVKLKELIRLVKHKLQNEHSIEIRDVRLNGGAASYVLAPENSHYNDLDLVFGTDLSNEDRFDVIRDVVLECLMEFYPREHNAQKQQQCQQEGLPISCEHLSRVSTTNNIHSDARPIDDDAQSEHSSRSNRSSSFESDNLNITTNESDDDESEEEDENIIVRIDSHAEGEKDNKDNHSDIQGRIKSNSHGMNTEALDHSRSKDDKDAKLSEAHAVSVGDNVKEQSNQHNYSQHAIQYQHIQMPPSNCAIKEAYVHKMVKVNDDDRWSLISLGVQQSETSNYNQLHQQHQTSVSYGQTANPTAHVADLSTCYNGSNAQKTGSGLNVDSKDHYNNQLRQSPNSIELKFVDRMRRKFEFSVDSFQIILDSLIQFYDYAPQSTITIQRKSVDVHPSSTMINTHPSACRRSCGHCCVEPSEVTNCTANNHEGDNLHCASQQETFSSKTKVINDFLDNEKKRGRHHHKNCKASLGCPRSYYELQLDPSNSLSNSSVASSSGCSSSSSVVSSSSSSLSYDEDQEDLYCDVDSPPSSSASTSSLLSTTTVSVLSPKGNSCELADHQGQSKKADTENVADRQMGQKSTISKQTEKQASKTGSTDCQGSFEKLRLKKEAKKQCKIDVSDLFRENLCDFGTGKLSSCSVISENFYPTVIGRSEYGNFKEALYHLEKKLIATRSPEEIRGGGLLKYCNLLVKNYKPTNVYQIRTLERYMCSRFFIDFSDLNQQRAKLESYLANHFSDDPMQKYDYLTILHNVVQRSTVCLMNHELRLTLNMIRELAYELNEQQHQGQQGKPLSMGKAAQQRVPPMHQQSSLNQPSRQHDEQQHHQYQQQKPVVLQSGAYRVKLVNYALAKSA